MKFKTLNVPRQPGPLQCDHSAILRILARGSFRQRKKPRCSCPHPRGQVVPTPGPALRLTQHGCPQGSPVLDMQQGCSLREKGGGIPGAVNQAKRPTLHSSLSLGRGQGTPKMSQPKDTNFLSKASFREQLNLVGILKPRFFV